MPTLMLLSKDYPTDPRVVKEAKSLRNAGYPIIVFSLDRPSTDYNSFGFIGMLGKFWMGCLWQMKSIEFDMVHAHDFDTLPIGLMIAKLSNVPLVYDAHESYADMVESKVPPIVKLFIRFVERVCTRRCSKIIVANSAISYLVSDTPKECDVVMNCPPINTIPIRPHNGSHLRIGYFGSLEPERFILEAIEVVKELPSCGMVIGGSGSLEQEIVRQANGNERIAFIGKLSPSLAYQVQSLCDLQLVIFKDSNANNIIGTPNRLFEAMSLGIPIVANWKTESGAIVEKNDCGFVCSYSVFPFKAILEYLIKHREILKEKGMNGLTAHRTKYNWESQEKVLLDVYRTVRGN